MRTLEPAHGEPESLRTHGPENPLTDDQWLKANHFEHLQSHRLEAMELTPQEERELADLRIDLKTSKFILKPSNGGGVEQTKDRWSDEDGTVWLKIRYRQVSGKMKTGGDDLSVERTKRRRERFLAAKQLKAKYYQYQRLETLAVERGCRDALEEWHCSKPVTLPNWARQATAPAGQYGGSVAVAQDWLSRHNRMLH